MLFIIIFYFATKPTIQFNNQTPTTDHWYFRKYQRRNVLWWRSNRCFRHFKHHHSIAILNPTCHKFFQRHRNIRFQYDGIFDCKESIQQISDLSDVLESKFDSFNSLRQQSNEVRAGLMVQIRKVRIQWKIMKNSMLEKLDEMSNGLEIQLKRFTQKNKSRYHWNMNHTNWLRMIC